MAERRPPIFGPAWSPGDEEKPEWWQAVKRSRPLRAQTPLLLDPRPMLEELGEPDPSDPDDPAPDRAYDRLIALLHERRAAERPPEKPHVYRRFRQGRTPLLAFETPYDPELVASIKRRIPGRRFDWDTRRWEAPLDLDGVLSGAAAVVRAHPWLRVEPALAPALERALTVEVAVTQTVEGEPALALLEPPGALAEELGTVVGRQGGWTLVGLDGVPAREILERRDLEPDPPARAVLEELVEQEAPPPGWVALDATNALFRVRAGWSTKLLGAAGELPEARRVHDGWERAFLDGGADAVAVPADAALVPALDEFLASWPELVLEEPARRRVELLRRVRAEAEATVALSEARDGPPQPAAVHGELRPFQRAGVAYLLRRRRAILADEQGLGKTVQALAALEADGAWPALVVCPAGLKLNWEREAQAWLPHRSVALLRGRGAASVEAARDADLVVCNYEILDAHLERLTGEDGRLARPLRALVLDEAHYVKEPRARRTKAAVALSRALDDDALRLALTGTPVVNRPKELVSQLRAIGRLDEFGSGAAFARRFRDRAAHERLHWNLRASCFVRRRKAEVLPQLPAKTTHVVPVELANVAEYRHAEADLVGWLRAQPLDDDQRTARERAAERAEQLVRLNALRLLVARGKLAAALGWVEDFLASGEPLVVFAEHVEVQRALVERFDGDGAVHVLGADAQEARQRAVDAFQAPDGPSLIVCSMRAAGHGITLTRASNVCFLELDWTPARHDQAEDRVHRIGQRDAVTAHYLLAPETIDETMAELLGRKRGTIDAVTDGRAGSDESVQDGLVRALRDGGVPKLRHLRVA